MPPALHCLTTGLLSQTHAVVRVGHSTGDATVNLASKASIAALFQKTGAFDALVCAAGTSRFGTVQEAGDRTGEVLDVRDFFRAR